MEIKAGAPYPASALSNLAPHKFVFDGVKCASIEGLLQAFKFGERRIQLEVCALAGREAKKRGASRDWQRNQRLFWGGYTFERRSEEYQRLVDSAYDALYTNDRFRAALVAARDAVFTHSIGSTDVRATVLTNDEFCSRLSRLRDRAVSEAAGPRSGRRSR